MVDDEPPGGWIDTVSRDVGAEEAVQDSLRLHHWNPTATVWVASVESPIEQGIEKLHESGPRRISPFTVPRLMLNSAAGNISIRHGLKGPNSAIGTACATGGHNILSACDLIRLGRADVMVAGGSEASITPLCIGSFGAMKAMSTARNESPTEASRPFDRDRDGFVMGEGAAILVLESLAHAKARGARVHAEILGGGIGDAEHPAPDENGEGGGR